jgi:hypothetical protein
MRRNSVLLLAWLAVVSAAGCSKPADNRRLEDEAKQSMETERSADQLNALRTRLATTQRDN